MVTINRASESQIKAAYENANGRDGSFGLSDSKYASTMPAKAGISYRVANTYEQTKVSLNEFQRAWRAAEGFKAADSNRSGKLTRDEYNSVRSKLGLGDYDSANLDGKNGVSVSEFFGALEKLRKSGAAGGNGPGQSTGSGSLNLKNKELKPLESEIKKAQGVLDSSMQKLITFSLIAGQTWLESRGDKNAKDPTMPENKGVLQNSQGQWNNDVYDKVPKSVREKIQNVIGKDAKKLDVDNTQENLIAGICQVAYYWLPEVKKKFPDVSTEKQVSIALGAYYTGEIKDSGDGKAYANVVRYYQSQVEKGNPLPDDDRKLPNEIKKDVEKLVG